MPSPRSKDIGTDRLPKRANPWGLRLIGRMTRCEHCGSLHEIAPEAVRGPIESEALEVLSGDLMGITEDGWRFFRALWSPSPGYRTVKEMAADLAVNPSTLVSRFVRARLPGVKDYIASAMLVRAARELERPGATIVSVAYSLDCSSSQSFCRIVRQRTGLSPAKWRGDTTGAVMLARFRAELIVPYRARLIDLAPLREVA
jgi:AraC-like DNA-binding protein